MKKIVSLILCILMLSSLFTVMTAAEDDADVSYSVNLVASAPQNGQTYSVGETVTLTVAVSTGDSAGTMGTGITAPIYAFNGVLSYDAFMLRLMNTHIPSQFSAMASKNDASNGRITFSFLCSANGSGLVGVPVESEFILVKYEFVALKDGFSSTSLSDMIITDKNANARPITSSSIKVDVSVGSGVTVSDAQTLERVIKGAKQQLDAAIMNPSGELVYPAFTVSQATYNALDAAIKAAEKALLEATQTDEFLSAEKALTSAVFAYDAEKIYGKRPNDYVGGGSGESTTEYIEVTAVAGEHGQVAEYCTLQLVRYGTSATAIAIPDDGYEVEKVVVNGKEYAADEIVTIASVTSKTHIEFYFKEKPKAPRFADVAPGAWYFESVEKIAEMGLFAGTSETEFSPNMPMTRAMLVTVLHRLEGTPEVNTDVTFSDVAADKWYTEAIAWASANGIVNGYSADTFGTNDSISRQDMVTILYRYLTYKGLTPAEGTSLDAYADADAVSTYAKPAMEWATATGLVKGTSDTTLSPRDNCTRAQVATIILRYTQNVSAE